MERISLSIPLLLLGCQVLYLDQDPVAGRSDLCIYQKVDTLDLLANSAVCPKCSQRLPANQISLSLSVLRYTIFHTYEIIIRDDFRHATSVKVWPCYRHMQIYSCAFTAQYNHSMLIQSHQKSAPGSKNPTGKHASQPAVTRCTTISNLNAILPDRSDWWISLTILAQMPMQKQYIVGDNMSNKPWIFTKLLPYF